MFLYSRMLLIGLTSGVNKMGQLIVVIILIIPVYGILIWSYFFPQDSYFWGKRWMYEEEPELSAGAIRYIKVTSIIGMIVFTLIFVGIFIKLI